MQKYQKTFWKTGDKIKAVPLNNLEDQVARNSDELMGFSEGFNSLNATLVDLNTSTSSLSEQVKNLANSLGGQGESDPALISKVNELVEKSNELENINKEVVANITALKNNVKEIKTDLLDISGKANSNTVNINTLNPKVDNLVEGFNGLTEDNLKTNIQLNALNDLLRYRDVDSSVDLEENEIATDTIVGVYDASFNNSKTVTSKGLVANNVTLDSAFFDARVANNIDMSAVKTQGELVKATSQAVLKFRNNGTVYLNNLSLNGKSYNGIEIGLPLTVGSTKTYFKAKSIYVSDLVVEETTNNGVSVFDHSANANMTFINCHFKTVSNCFRFSNVSNVPATITFINCTCDEWAEGEYAGMICLQDYISLTAEEAKSSNRFANLTLHFINCSGPNGPIMPRDEEEICGSRDENQLLYIYNNKEGFVDYDPNRYPEIIIENE